MINSAFSIEPYSTATGCGDFCHHVSLTTSDVFVVGDLTGHGNPAFEPVTREISEFCSAITDPLNLIELANDCANIVRQHQLSVSLFIGRFDRQLPLLQYVSVGDLRALRLRQTTRKSLATQQGSLGIHHPQQIKEFALKLNDKDRIVITSDGIRQLPPAGIEQVAACATPDECLKLLFSDYMNRDDDSVALVADYRASNSAVMSQPSSPPARTPVSVVGNNTGASPPPEPTIPVGATHAVQSAVGAEISTPQPMSITNPTALEQTSEHQERYLNTVKDIKPRAQAWLSASDISNPRNALIYLFQALGLAQDTGVRLTSLCLELLDHGASDMDLFLEPTLLTLQFSCSKHLALQSVPLWRTGSLHYSNRHKCLQWQLTLVAGDQEQQEALVDLREMIQLDIDPQRYAQYKQDKDRDKLLAEQSKLALMGEMIGLIAHQWRQPLNELALQVQGVQLDFIDGLLTEETMNDFVTESLDSIKHMSQTIDDFRHFFREDKSVTTFDLKELADETLALQRSQLASQNITVEMQGENNQVQAVRAELKQVLMNLISNAKDALRDSTPPHVIQITTSGNNVEVWDSGGGMTDEVLAKAFEPYFTTKKHGEGTGLGLYMSRMIVEKNLRGSLELRNELRGSVRGLAVKITLPVAASE